MLFPQNLTTPQGIAFDVGIALMDRPQEGVHVQVRRGLAGILLLYVPAASLSPDLEIVIIHGTRCAGRISLWTRFALGGKIGRLLPNSDDLAFAGEPHSVPMCHWLSANMDKIPGKRPCEQFPSMRRVAPQRMSRRIANSNQHKKNIAEKKNCGTATSLRYRDQSQ